ncbi:serine/threonine protein kinase [Candidatus Woesearchaeota archaeon]|nr:serine/threonine protein kinase [Candidatus Woesearchaeota archaeon]
MEQGFNSNKKIGAYTILGELGRGGMGVVFEAIDPIGRHAALKLILEPDEELVRQFNSEAKALAQLEGRGICRLMHFDTYSSPTGPLPYFVMQKIEGKTLEKLVAENSLPMRERVEIMTEVCTAMANAHAKGVIHRDLKPSNVMHGNDGTYVMDFGLAKRVKKSPASNASLSGEGIFKGTYSYASPEQIRGGRLNFATDNYALGITAYELFTGRKFTKCTNFINYLASRMRGERPGFEGYPPDTPPELRSIIEAALSTKPEDRPTAEELRENFKAFLHGDEVRLHDYDKKEKMSRWLRKNGTRVAALSTIPFFLLGSATLALSLHAKNIDAQHRLMQAESQLLAAQNQKNKAQENARAERKRSLEKLLSEQINNKNWEAAEQTICMIREPLITSENPKELDWLAEKERYVKGYAVLNLNTNRPTTISELKGREVWSGSTRSSVHLLPGVYVVKSRNYVNVIEMKRWTPLELSIRESKVPPGFVPIPAGPAMLEDGEVQLGDFAIGPYITFRDYFLFLEETGRLGSDEHQPKFYNVNKKELFAITPSVLRDQKLNEDSPLIATPPKVLSGAFRIYMSGKLGIALKLPSRAHIARAYVIPERETIFGDDYRPGTIHDASELLIGDKMARRHTNERGVDIRSLSTLCEEESVPMAFGPSFTDQSKKNWTPPLSNTVLEETGHPYDTGTRYVIDLK